MSSLISQLSILNRLVNQQPYKGYQEKSVFFTDRGLNPQSLVAFYPVITVFYRVITGFLTFCSDRGKFGLTAPLLGPNYRYRDLPEITGGTYRVC